MAQISLEYNELRSTSLMRPQRPLILRPSVISVYELELVILAYYRWILLRFLGHFDASLYSRNLTHNTSMTNFLHNIFHQNLAHFDRIFEFHFAPSTMLFVKAEACEIVVERFHYRKVRMARLGFLDFSVGICVPIDFQRSRLIKIPFFFLILLANESPIFFVRSFISGLLPRLSRSFLMVKIIVVIIRFFCIVPSRNSLIGDIVNSCHPLSLTNRWRCLRLSNFSFGPAACLL